MVVWKLWSNVIAKAGESDKKRYRVESRAFWNKTGGVKMEHKKLEVGEKYLSIRLNVGGQNFDFAAFKNKEKKGNEPDFKGQNIGVWLVVKKSKEDSKEEYL